MVFSFISMVLFIGLSFGLYSKDSLPTTEFKNGLQVTIKTTNEDGSSVDDPFYLNQVFNNLSGRLQEKYPDKRFDLQRETNGVFNLKATDINTEKEKQDFLNYLLEKQKLTITTLNQKYGEDPFYNKDTAQVFIGTSGQPNETSYNLSFQRSAGDNYSGTEVYQLAKQNKAEKVLLWKNFDKLKEIVANDIAKNVDNIANSEYNNEYYRYLFVDGITPATNPPPPPAEGEQTPPQKFYFFKEKLVDAAGKEYHPTDFLVAVNELEDYNNKPTLTISKDFGAANWKVQDKDKQEQLRQEFVDVRYWLNDYNLSNNIASFVAADQGGFAYWIFITAIVSFFAILSIFAVINYGYLGIIALFLLAIIVFLSLLMMTVFIGNYDTITVLAILMSTLIAFDSIVLFCEKIKKEVKKGHSIPKAIKNTIKTTNKGDYIKMFVLLVGLATIYAFLSRFAATFSLLTLSTIIFIPLIMLLGLRVLAKVFIGISKMENNGRTVGFWRHKVEIKLDSAAESTNYLFDQIQQEEQEHDLMQKSPTFRRFKKINAKSWWIGLGTFGALLFGGIIVFLSLFFTSPDGFRLSPNTQEQTVLRIGDNENSDPNKIENIKKDLTTQYQVPEGAIKIHSPNLIEVNLPNDFANEKLNSIATDLISKYNVRVIESRLIDTATIITLKFALISISVALIVMTIFVLFWMNWTKALTFLAMAIISTISFVLLLMLGIIELSPFVATLGILTFLIFGLTNLNTMIKFSAKLKTKRIEEMHYESIWDLIGLVTFKNLKSILLTHGLFLATFSLFLIAFGALPFSVMLFLIVFGLINFVFSFFLMPAILVSLEAWRAKIVRSRILNHHWETEKIHEQVFAGINNVK